MDLEVLIVGGGIHGVGLMHDLASRRIPGVHLVEENTLASGTSSRSTKLVHGGLRYLEHLKQWGLVREALQERAILLRVLRGIVQPLPFVLPAFKGDRPPWMLRAGLFLYDTLGGDGGLPHSRKLSNNELLNIAPYLKKDRIDSDMSAAFLFYDAQMLDDVIVKIAAQASLKMGATFSEKTSVTHVESLKGEKGFRVTLSSHDANGNSVQRQVTSRFVVNAAGAWCNANLLRWGIKPDVSCLLNVGSHLVFGAAAVSAKPSECAATLLQNRDGRVVFFIPWNGRWLFGTTESVLAHGNPRALVPPPADRDYLMKAAQHTLDLKNPDTNLEEFFCGVRTMPLRTPVTQKVWDENWVNDPFDSPFYLRNAASTNISALSRETVISEVLPNLLSIYGGKYTTYRAQCEKLGSLLSRRLGTGGRSRTQVSESWFLSELLAEQPEIFKSSAILRQE